MLMTNQVHLKSHQYKDFATSILKLTINTKSIVKSKKHPVYQDIDDLLEFSPSVDPSFSPAIEKGFAPLALFNDLIFTKSVCFWSFWGPSGQFMRLLKVTFAIYHLKIVFILNRHLLNFRKFINFRHHKILMKFSVSKFWFLYKLYIDLIKYDNLILFN